MFAFGLWFIINLNFVPLKREKMLRTWLTVSRGPHARSVNSFDKQQRGQTHTAASTAQLPHSSADGASVWELWRLEREQKKSE